MTGAIIKNSVVPANIFSYFSQQKQTLTNYSKKKYLQNIQIFNRCILHDLISFPVTKLKNSMNIEENDFIDAYKKPRPSGLGERLVFYGLSNVKSESALELAHKAGFKK